MLSANGEWLVLASGVASRAKDYASDNEYTCVTSLSRNASHKIDNHDTMSGGSIGGAGSVAMALNDATQNFAIDTFSLQRSSAGGTEKVSVSPVLA